MSLAVGFSLALVASAAPAQPPRTVTLRLSVTGGAEACVSQPALEARLEARLGRAVFADRDAEASVEGVLERSDRSPRWRATFVVSGPDGSERGRRDLSSDAEDCGAVQEALALVLTVMIDPSAALAPEPQGAPVPPPQPPPVEPPPPPAREPPTPRPSPAPARRPWHLRFALGPTAAIGLLPRLAAGGRVAVAVAPPDLPLLELEAVYWAQGRETAGGGTASFQVVEAAASLFAVLLRTERFEVGPTAGLRAGLVTAAGHDLENGESARRPLVEPFAGLRFEVRIAGPLFAGGGVALAVPLVRDEFYVDDPTTGRRRVVHRVSPLVGTGELHLGLRWPAKR